MTTISAAGRTRAAAEAGRGRAPGRPRRRRGPAAYLTLIAVTVFALIILIPFALVIINAIKPQAQYASQGPLSLPHGFDTSGIRTFWDTTDFGRALWNSVKISGSVAVAAVLLSILNAYALGIGRIKGRTWILAAFLIANFLPQEGLVYPLYYLAKRVGLYDTQLSVIIIFTVIQAAFGTYLLSSVLSTFPRELLEAARMDGAGRSRILWRIVVPISRPTLAVLLVFFFIWTWNEFFLPLVFLVSNQNQTVPVALGTLQGQHIMNPLTTSAAALLGMFPTIIFFLIFQRTLTRGITVGAVK
jgi:raffinose/stachyose/melibiose transport system permease protein